MYMPGRSRTGSSPSRTVMSLAVYVASLIEKALQTKRLRALRILSERAVGSGACETQCGRFRHDSAQIVVLDRGGERRPRCELGNRGYGRRKPARVRGRGCRLWQRAHQETELRHTPL